MNARLSIRNWIYYVAADLSIAIIISMLTLVHFYMFLGTLLDLTVL